MEKPAEERDRIFISSRQHEMKEYRRGARYACGDIKCDPFAYEWEVIGGAKDMVSYLSGIAINSKLFIGIYGNEYGERTITDPDSDANMISPIEFEFKLAIKHFAEEDRRLYILNSMTREDALTEMIGNYTCIPFNTPEEFELRMEIDLKEWQTKQISNKETPSKKDERIMSVEVKCNDMTGVLANICEAIYEKRGNIIGAKQTVYQNVADVKILLNWLEGVEPKKEETIKEAIKDELAKCGEVSMGSAKVIVRDNPSQIKKVTERGHYIVEFFDSPGIAGQVFKVFSSKGISVLESTLEQFATTFEMGRYHIIVNLTSMIEKREAITEAIEEIHRVFRVTESIDIGTWWY